jgi:protein phosphatase 2C family protein 2/3
LNLAQSGIARSAFGPGQPQEPVLDTSGSCAVVLLFINEVCYIANLGDSRAVLSSNQGTTVTPLSVDHKPNEPSEYARIIKYGGSVYQ